jgi:hypothetical protein
MKPTKYSLYKKELRKYRKTPYLRPRINRTFLFLIFDLSGVPNTECQFF